MIRRRVTRLLLLFVVTVLGWANTHTTAVSVPRASVASYTYDSPIPNGPTGYAATERVPPMQLVTSIAPAGQVVVGHGSDGTSAGQKIGASVVTATTTACHSSCKSSMVTTPARRWSGRPSEIFLRFSRPLLPQRADSGLRRSCASETGSCRRFPRGRWYAEPDRQGPGVRHPAWYIRDLGEGGKRPDHGSDHER